MSRPPFALPYAVLGIIIVCGLVALLFLVQPPKPIMSNWGGNRSTEAPPAVIGGVAQPQPAPAASPIIGVAQAQGVGQAALDAYTQASSLRDDVGEGRVRFFQRDIAGGSLDFIVVRLNERVHVEMINADGATPGSDERGDTIWSDGQRHLRTVEEMANAPYATREGMELLGAIAFGFHGEPRTANEGTVVINGQVLRSNPGRGTLCITTVGQAKIGLFTTEALAECQQAFGGGPVIVWENKIANPDVGAVEGESMPFNPLNEDFVQIDWRKQIYTGLFPKTAAGIGMLENGESYLVLATSQNMLGIDLARQLRDMGCYAALGGDDDTSTQMVWRGQLVRQTNPRAVPDAISVYLKNG